MITFDKITSKTELIEENEFYKLYHNHDARFMYDYNFMRLKYQPTLEEFKLIEKILLEFHEDMEMDHVKFYWPEDLGFTEPIVDYLSNNGYGIEILELYAIEPKDFIPSNGNSAVTVELVTEETLEDFKQINRIQDVNISKTFAEQKKELYDQDYDDSAVQQVIAYLNDTPVGSVDLLIKEETIEIDNFFVLNEYQRQGIGTEIQKFVMEIAGSRTVILVADAEDTPKDMYLKQNYTYLSYQVGALKELSTYDA